MWHDRSDLIGMDRIHMVSVDVGTGSVDKRIGNNRFKTFRYGSGFDIAYSFFWFGNLTDGRNVDIRIGPVDLRLGRL